MALDSDTGGHVETSGSYALALQPSAVQNHRPHVSNTEVRRTGRVGFHSPKQEESPRQQLIDILTERGRGSFLRGWRRELDRDGDLEVCFQEFCAAAGRLGFHGDVCSLLGLDDNPRTLSLMEVSPESDALFNKFRDWAKDTFGGFAETFCALDATGRGQITLEMFLAACKRNHFQARDDDIAEIFRCLDVDFTENLSLGELIFLEKDGTVREQARHTEKQKQKEKHLKLMACAYFEDSKRFLQPTHRCAPRPWLSRNFEDLPMLINHRRVEWQRASYQRSLEARIAFLRHLRNTFGNEVRAWRLGLDPDCRFEIDLKVIRRFCRKADLKVDTAALWKSLDKDCDGVIRLEELSIRGADILASFQMWAIQEFGTCAALWDCEEMAFAREKHARNSRVWSEKKMLFNGFHEVLKACKCPLGTDADMVSVLLNSLDAHACGFIERADLEWLDKWEPPEWLCAEPDPSAWEGMKEMMLRIYKHPLKAWRNLLDTDNSNNVSWVEFREACEKLRYKGNMAGAWRALNQHLSSSISMKEYDAESAHLLETFKDWADTNFGSVAKAFKAVDENGSGYVTCAELRRACHKLKYCGDCKLLFDCLDIEGKMHSGKRCISLKEVEFLDDWEGDSHPAENVEDHVVHQALAKKATRTVQASSSLPVLPMRLTHTKSSGGTFLASPSGDSSTASWSQPTQTSVISDKERLRRTYHCGTKARGRAPRGARESSKLFLPSPTGHRTQTTTEPFQGKQTLPWLQKLMAL